MHAAVTLTRRTESTLREEHLRRDSAGVMTASVVRVRKASGGTTARLDDSCGRHRAQQPIYPAPMPRLTWSKALLRE